MEIAGTMKAWTFRIKHYIYCIGVYRNIYLMADDKTEPIPGFSFSYTVENIKVPMNFSAPFLFLLSGN